MQPADPWFHLADVRPDSHEADDLSTPVTLVCAHCAAENGAAATRCTFCHVDFRDLPPREWAVKGPTA